MEERNFLRFSLAFFGGLFAGLSLLQANFIFMPIALSFLWGICRSRFLCFVWGFFAILVSHAWLLSLHPLTWIGIPKGFSLLISILIWFSCGVLGGTLVNTWSFLGKVLSSTLFSDNKDESLGSVLFAFIMSGFWGLSEVLLSSSPLFWIGVGGSSFAGNTWFGGIARWIGAGGLATVQLMLGWWLWRLGLAFYKGIKWNRFLIKGLILILFINFLGFSLLRPGLDEETINIAVWQTAIPIRNKFSDRLQLRLPDLIQSKLLEAQKLKADVLIAPEGLMMANQTLLNSSPITFISGGFRWVDGKLRSSLLLFEKGDKSFSSVIDKYRLVPLGESIPNLKVFNLFNLSAIGGIYHGDKSRLSQWSGNPFAALICYEISDGSLLSEAISKGAEWIISIANLDPYPISLQREYLALARLRSIESSRDIIVASNTGPSVLISSDGSISNKIEPFIESIDLFEIGLKNTMTGYLIWKDYPLLLSVIAASFIRFIRKNRI